MQGLVGSPVHPNMLAGLTAEAPQKHAEHAEHALWHPRQVEEHYRVEGQQVLWYVASDCARLRGRAAERYGAKVLLPQGEAPVEHVMESSGNATRDALAFRVAFAEQWLLGMTDFQVGRQAV